MKKYRYLAFFVFSVLLFNRCNSIQEFSQETAKLNEFLNRVVQPQISNQKEVYVFATVNTGCHSCYESVLNYAKSGIKSEELHFIFSSRGMKMLNMTLREKNISVESVILDGKFLAKSMDLIPNTAIAYFISGGEIVKTIDVNSSNVDDTFEIIMEYIVVDL